MSDQDKSTNVEGKGSFFEGLFSGTIGRILNGGFWASITVGGILVLLLGVFTMASGSWITKGILFILASPIILMGGTIGVLLCLIKSYKTFGNASAVIGESVLPVFSLIMFAGTYLTLNPTALADSRANGSIFVNVPIWAFNAVQSIVPLSPIDLGLSTIALMVVLFMSQSGGVYAK